MTIMIRKPSLADFSQWTILWRAYLAFYESESVADEISELLWQRIHSLKNPIRCLVAQDSEDKQLVGFVHFLNHSDTWKSNDVCYLEDLFVTHDVRGKGVGATLIKAVHQQAIENEWDKVYWHTKHDNKQARVLYDKLTGGTDGFITYRLAIKK